MVERIGEKLIVGSVQQSIDEGKVIDWSKYDHEYEKFMEEQDNLKAIEEAKKNRFKFKIILRDMFL